MNVRRRTREVICCMAAFTQAIAGEVEPHISYQSSQIPRHKIPVSDVASPETVVGVYHWSGRATRSISQGVEAVAGLGGSAVRIVLSPRSHRDYNISSDCIRDFNLASMVQEPDVRQALSHPAIRTIMITAFDGASFADCETQAYLNPRFYTPENRARLVAEYADLAYELYRSYAESGKTFLISNWESDNTVFCGSAYAYAVDLVFRKECDESYPTWYGGNSGPAASMEGLRHWFSVRWEGIEEGRQRAARTNLTGVVVLIGPEINSVRALAEAGLASVLTHVVPLVASDFISYSSWETINRPSPSQELKQDIEIIRGIAGNSEVILGELGYASAHWGVATLPRADEAISAASDLGIPCVFLWVLYDDAAHGGFGLLDGSGIRTELGSYYHRRLSAIRRK